MTASVLAACPLLAGCVHRPGMLSAAPDRPVQRSDVPNWERSGVNGILYAPEGWSTNDPTVIFAPGGGIAPSAYGCYGRVWGKLGIRTLIPELADGANREIRKERWRQLRVLYGKVTAEQNPQKVIFAGHSAGAYLTLLAAGADSRLGMWDMTHCTDQGCAPLLAAGYIVISGQAAQNAEGEPPFWFAREAFRRLAPNRFIVYGTRDHMPTDPCTNREDEVPTCRGDAYTVDHDRGDAGQSVLRVVDGFTHYDFLCHESHLGARGVSERREELALEMGQWIRSVVRR